MIKQNEPKCWPSSVIVTPGLGKECQTKIINEWVEFFAYHLEAAIRVLPARPVMAAPFVIGRPKRNTTRTHCALRSKPSVRSQLAFAYQSTLIGWIWHSRPTSLFELFRPAILSSERLTDNLANCGLWHGRNLQECDLRRG